MELESAVEGGDGIEVGMISISGGDIGESGISCTSIGSKAGEAESGELGEELINSGGEHGGGAGLVGVNTAG